ncbi:MAG: DUF1553 domain-containing protein [Planctomycetaceae bacterium]
MRAEIKRQYNVLRTRESSFVAFLMQLIDPMASCFGYGRDRGRGVQTGCLAWWLVSASLAIAQPSDFDDTVAPILAAHCLECHGGPEPKGGLDLSRAKSALEGGDSGAVIAINDSGASLLWERISRDEMPPKHQLSSAEKDVIRQWIDGGAEWGTSPIDPFAVTTSQRAGYDWWSLQPLAAPQSPDIDSRGWARNEIDAFVFRKLHEADLQPSSEANPRVLVRRLYFDLIGLPPTPETVAQFAADPSESAYQQLVNDLLASQHYGERWGRHWLDVVRFGESSGFERNEPRLHAWPYRDWVINALNSDLPYDDFVRMQLIGDQLVPGIEGAAATGFWVAGVHNTVVGGSKRMKLLARQDELEEVLATVGQTFLGLTVNCARCHDHKFDPIKQKEFYQLASAISGLGYGERTEQSAEATARLNEIHAQLSMVNEELATINNTARHEIISARGEGEVQEPDLPGAFARWEFDSDLKDSMGTLHGTAQGNAHIENGALVVDGTSFVVTTPVPEDVSEKTLEVWVQLDTLQQRGGGVMSIETPDGNVFDSIVFAEREQGRWMSGSNGFARTDSFHGQAETEVQQRPVHFAIVYKADGTILGYRDGVQYGQSVQKAPLQTYSAGNSEMIFGLRHKPAGGNRWLTGRIHRAALYDRALSAEEVAASSGNSAQYVTEQQITEWISENQLEIRTALIGRSKTLADQRDRQAQLASRKFYTLTPKEGAITHVLLRGDPENAGEQVSPAAVAAVAGVDSDFHLAPNAREDERRRQLAQWIADPANPLFSRVIVNRVWHYHFGTGLVDTPNDFGFNGGRPSHSQLLEWLAVWFRDNGFRLKDLHRLLVTSRTWRQAAFDPASTTPDGAAIDAGNRLLWRMAPRRLEAESIRDSMLSVAGKLNTQLGGNSFVDVSIVSNNGTTYYDPIDVDGDAFFRRTVYRFNPRGGRSALLDTFDCPDPANTAPRRAVTTTPLQALSLLNNSFVLQMSTYLAERVKNEVGSSISEQVSRAWQLAVARQPTVEEQKLSIELVSKHGLPALCRGLFNISEFVLVE